MKASFLKVTILTLVTILSFSCSKDEESSSTDTGGGSTTTTNTWVKLTAITAGGVAKSNYVVMMFDEPVTVGSALPPIKKQVTTDANGLAYFDLNTLVTSTTPTTYYFEAFVLSGGNYVMKSVSHPTYNIVKGQKTTSSIIVN